MALAAMRKSNDEFEAFVTISMAATMNVLPIGLVVPVQPPMAPAAAAAAPRAPRVRAVPSGAVAAPRRGLARQSGAAGNSAPARGARQLPTFSQASVESAVAQMARPANAHMTVGARAIAKKIGHAEAGGYRSAFEGIPRTTEGAQSVIREIMSNPSRTVFGNRTYDVYDVLGRGARFDLHGNFKGFLEAARATR